MLLLAASLAAVPVVHLSINPAEVKAEVSRTLYGTGMEDVNHEIYGGLDAERLYMEGFEAPPPKNRAEKVSGFWTAIAEENGTFEFDTTVKKLGGASQALIPNGGKAGVANMGLRGWGIPSREGRKMVGHVWVRGTVDAIEFALERYDGRKVYATNRVEKVAAGENWTKVEFSLVPRVTDPMSRFRVSATGQGKVWLDDASLRDEPTNEFGRLGCREDIVEGFRRQGLTFLRWGGSMVNVKDYLYRHMTGERTFYHGMWDWWSSYAFAIPEFVRMSALLKLPCAFSINAYESTEDAVKLAEWLKSFDIPLYVQIGNEECAGYNKYCGTCDIPSVRRYAESVRRIVPEMRKVNPKLKFVNAIMWNEKKMDVMEEGFRQLDGVCEYWDLHVGSGWWGAGNGARQTFKRFRDMVARLNPDSKMKVAIFEENANIHDMNRALAHASILMACREQGDFLLTSCPANALQPYNHNDNGWDQGQIFFTPDRVWLQPCAWAQQMASANHRDLLVAGTVDDKTVQVSPTCDREGRSLVVHLINGDKIAKVPSFSFGNSCEWKVVKVTALWAPQLNSHNPPDNPEFVSPKEVTKAFCETPELKPYSYTIVEFMR